MNRLRQLLASNRSQARRYEIVAKADSADIYLYDVIDPFWGVSAAQFVKDLNALTAPTIHLHINSPGGDVFDGRAIATAIRQHPSDVIAHVDGLAASAASFIATAADQVEMAPGAFMMIHRAWGFVAGNAEDLVKIAATLEKIDESLVSDYARETGQSEAQIREWMNAETWFTDQEAVANGFADRVAEADPKAQNRWDLSAFSRAPEAALPPQKPEAPDTHSLEAEHEERQRRFALTEHRIA